MNASQPTQLTSTTIRAARAIVLAAGLAGTALGTLASTLDSRTVYQAEAASLYDTYYDVPSGFVFVKLPTGWRFVGQDTGGRPAPITEEERPCDPASHSYEVFLDTPTGFVFVKTSEGWRFITPQDHDWGTALPVAQSRP